MTIAECAIGVEIQLATPSFDDAVRFRLRELGLGDGVRARIVQRAPFGGRILAVGGQRIAVDGDTTRRLAVEPITTPGA